MGQLETKEGINPDFMSRGELEVYLDHLEGDSWSDLTDGTWRDLGYFEDIDITEEWDN